MFYPKEKKRHAPWMMKPHSARSLLTISTARPFPHYKRPFFHVPEFPKVVFWGWVLTILSFPSPTISVYKPLNKPDFLPTNSHLSSTGFQAANRQNLGLISPKFGSIRYRKVDKFTNIYIHILI
jgi:hypothetical protein